MEYLQKNLGSSVPMLSLVSLLFSGFLMANVPIYHFFRSFFSGFLMANLDFITFFSLFFSGFLLGSGIWDPKSIIFLIKSNGF